MNCKNKYCPIVYSPDKKICQECKYKPDISTMDLPSGFEEIFRSFETKKDNNNE